MYPVHSGIQVKTEFFPLAFLLFACTPRVVINGQEYRLGWGVHFFPLPPGAYEVEIFFPYLFMNRCGYNRTQAVVGPDQVTTVSFYMPPLMFIAGSISLGSLPPGTATTARPVYPPQPLAAPAPPPYGSPQQVAPAVPGAVHCPRCTQPVNAAAAQCPHCGWQIRAPVA